MGDKTRMHALARNPRAFIRPSPSRGVWGGVGRRTREAILLCEAAGYDWVIVETVGVGQSELLVSSMVDFFAVLVLPGGGDQLQGIKRGVLELADLVAVTKADGDGVERAEQSRAQFAQALRLMRPRAPNWRPMVLTCSAHTGAGVDPLVQKMAEFRDTMSADGTWDGRRAEQRVAWLWEAIERLLKDALTTDLALRTMIRRMEDDVRRGGSLPEAAARGIVERFTTARPFSIP